MKRSTRRLLASVVALAVLGAGGWWTYQRMYAAPKAELLAEIRRYEAGIEARQDELLRAGPIRERLSRLAATTLGSDEESVSAALRTATNEILASQHLADTRVSSTRPEAIRNPAATRVNEFSRDRNARNRPDFYVINASARGVGTFEQALRSLATLQSQAWVHRIDQWAITPVDRQRERFELSVGFSTLYFPEADLRPRQAAGARLWEPLNEASFTPYRSILARAAFKEPPAPRPPAPQAPAVAQAPAPPPPSPFADWRITAVVAGRSGEEVWLTNIKSGERATLSPGQSLLGAVFVEGDGETAMVEIGGARFLVRVGATLADRLAVDR